MIRRRIQQALHLQALKDGITQESPDLPVRHIGIPGTTIERWMFCIGLHILLDEMAIPPLFGFVYALVGPLIAFARFVSSFACGPVFYSHANSSAIAHLYQ